MDARTRITVNAATPPETPAPRAAAPAAQGTVSAPSAIAPATSANGALVDPFGRAITYLRISVTDRCDFRCRYCMSEHPDFLPKKEILTLEEIDRIASTFVRLGVRKLRLTGGEPLVRRNVMWLIRRLARHLEGGALRELTLTTNGSQLARFADELAAVGVRRVNVSLDTLDAEKFRAITRRGDLDKVQAGLMAAQRAGLHVKINTVALKGLNEHEIPDIIRWAHGQGFDISLIETMPMGETGEDRTLRYLPLSDVHRHLEEVLGWRLTREQHDTGGPSRYWRVAETGGRLGFITPLSAHFCDDCNRVRLTATGKLYMCLGQNEDADLRRVLREQAGDDAVLEQAIRTAVARKPRGHEFAIGPDAINGQMPRTMNVTGG